MKGWGSLFANDATDCAGHALKPTRARAMALETWQLTTIILLALVVFFLVIVMSIIMVIYLNKRGLLCFNDDGQRNKKDEEKMLLKYHNKGKGKKKKRNRIGHPEQKNGFSDPFVGRFSNPIQMEDFIDGENQDWDNPLFDVQAAKRKDAAITIQTWWRMTRLIDIMHLVHFNSE